MPGAPQDGSDEDASDRRRGEADAWNAFSLVLSGMLVWGGAGWLVSRWLGSQAWIGLGLMVGTGAGVGLVWLRYGRSA
jgi:ATP synthase protein I